MDWSRRKRTCLRSTKKKEKLKQCKPRRLKYCKKRKNLWNHIYKNQRNKNKMSSNGMRKKRQSIKIRL